jgi:hypothetical protein
MQPARPTLRCLREDLDVRIPPVDEPLEAVGHPLLTKVNQQFSSVDATHERIAAIDDLVLFKAKIQRWRGAVWMDDPSADIRCWLVAAGRREDGAPTDFYASLTATAVAARSRYNATHHKPIATNTYAAHLLPSSDDKVRYRAESAARLERRLAAAVHESCRASLLDGREHTATVEGAIIGVQIRANLGHETYVAVRIIGSVPEAVTVTVLDLVPGCDLDGWFPEYSMPERPLATAEQAWSNLMNPVEAGKLLADQ